MVRIVTVVLALGLISPALAHEWHGGGGGWHGGGWHGGWGGGWHGDHDWHGGGWGFYGVPPVVVEPPDPCVHWSRWRQAYVNVC